MTLSPRVQSAMQKASYIVDQTFAEEAAEHARAYDDLLHRLRAAVVDGNSRKVRSLQNRIFKSFSAKLVCLIHSLSKEAGLSPGQIMKMAAALNPSTDCLEPIRGWAEPKSSGKGWRPLCAFGPKRSALQTLCVDVIGACHETDEVNFLAKGMGAEIASDRMIEMIKKGSRFFVVVDIEDFFGSVQQSEVTKLVGLPDAVVKNCILIQPHAVLNVVGGLPPGITEDVLDGAIRRGLPQGSRASQLIAGMLLGPALKQLASADRLIVYGDDVAISACSEGEATALKKALPGMLKSHPAGPFRLKRCDIVHINNGFDFLKYRFRRSPFTGKVRRRPATRCYFRYEQRVVAIVVGSPKSRGEERVDLYTAAWIKSFTRWRPVELSFILLGLNTASAFMVGLKIKSKIAAKKLLEMRV